MFIISSNNQCHVNILRVNKWPNSMTYDDDDDDVNILIFLCFIYTDLKMTRLENSRHIVLNTCEYSKTALMTENVFFFITFWYSYIRNELYYPSMNRER